MPDGVMTLALRIDLEHFLDYADAFYTDRPMPLPVQAAR
jgi:hypothetical protein